MLRIGFRVGMLLGAWAILAAQTNAAAVDEKKGDEVERAITLNQVPAKAKATLLKAAGKNEIKEIEEVVLKVFEVEWTKGGKEIEVFIKPDGQVLMKSTEKAEADDEEDEGAEKKGKDDAEENEDDGELDEKEIGIDDLPDTVKATVKKLAGKNKIELEQLRMKLYEAEWMEGDREVEILVTADGKVVKPQKGDKASKKSKEKDKGDDKD